MGAFFLSQRLKQKFAILLFLQSSWALSQTLTINSTQNLSFGKLAAGSGGTVVVAPNGARSRTGGITLLSSGMGAEAIFSVSVDIPGTYSISLPASAVLTSGAFSMNVDTFTSLPVDSGSVSTIPSNLQVGATLQVASNQQSGTYSGTFSVILTYN